MQKRLKNVQNVMQQCLSFGNYASNECDQHTFCDDLQDTERRKKSNSKHLKSYHLRQNTFN